MKKAALLAGCLTGFGLVLVGIVSGNAADVNYYGLIKERRYQQMGPQPPMLQNDSAYGFQAIISPTNNSSVAGGILVLPDGADLALDWLSGMASYGLLAHFDTQSQLNSLFPTGNYKIIVQTEHEGVITNALAFPSDSYPSALMVRNANPLLDTDSNLPLILQWQPPLSRSSKDFILLAITDRQRQVLYSSDAPYGNNALNGLTTQTTIPAGTLQANQGYNVMLSYLKVAKTNTTSYPGVPGICCFMATTSFPIFTRATGEVQSYGLFKGVSYEQTNDNPELATHLPYGVLGLVNVTSQSKLTNAILNGSPSGPMSMTPMDWGFVLSTNYAHLETLDASFPASNFTFRIQGPQIDNALPVNLTNSTAPNAPVILNLAQCQNADPYRGFEIAWMPFLEGPIQLLIYRGEHIVLATPNIGRLDALNTKYSSIFIPPNVLSPGVLYRATLFFAQITGADEETTPGVICLSGFYASTTFVLKTQGLPNVAPPFWSHLTRLDNSLLQAQLSTDPGVTYAIESSTNLALWDPLLVTNAMVTNTWLVFPEAFDSRPARFYRARVGLP